MTGRLDKEAAAILQGTLDMLVLRALQLEPMHGWGITERIEQWSEEVLCVGQGTLYPALYRLERQGLVSSTWRSEISVRGSRLLWVEVEIWTPMLPLFHSTMS